MYYINMAKLREAVIKKRGERTMRQVIGEIEGVSLTTLSRVENGICPDMNHFLSFCTWLECHPSEFIETDNTEESNALLQLRASATLSTEMAQALEAILRAVYQQFGTDDRA